MVFPCVTYREGANKPFLTVWLNRATSRIAVNLVTIGTSQGENNLFPLYDRSDYQ